MGGRAAVKSAGAAVGLVGQRGAGHPGRSGPALAWEMAPIGSLTGLQPAQSGAQSLLASPTGGRLFAAGYFGVHVGLPTNKAGGILALMREMVGPQLLGSREERIADKGG